ncbi:hypothetical protein [Emticicia sp. TH156]|uniref:hypothetical protein n=1 Tax=Emticicia sp. TH156 TaxID=2067454 RepID=UPI001E3C5753|nr:hypothetical protein [Emticicia sp. TH156]
MNRSSSHFSKNSSMARLTPYITVCLFLVRNSRIIISMFRYIARLPGIQQLVFD